ncbi:unnamed protein product, partial [Rotaria sordida]
LGVDELIEYGTFNRLCENFLNEQCNLREKVCDMIMENKNSIGVIQKTTHIRPKVLLIDEVDVFLSEKFYGGMYTSSVFLKDPTTKSLLDTIWNSKPICRLSDVKDTPAYNACANRFSNWTFLLDGAVKNMIAALKSYQSSTYSVENDRI